MINRYLPKIGSVKNALEALLHDRKVRRRNWSEDRYLFIDKNECLLYGNCEEGDIDTDDAIAKDWEIYEKPSKNDTIDSLEAAFRYLIDGWCVRSKSWEKGRYVKLEYTGHCVGLYNQDGHEVTGASLIIPKIESWEIFGGSEVFPGISEHNLKYLYTKSGSFIKEEKEHGSSDGYMCRRSFREKFL